MEKILHFKVFWGHWSTKWRWTRYLWYLNVWFVVSKNYVHFSFQNLWMNYRVLFSSLPNNKVIDWSKFQAFCRQEINPFPNNDTFWRPWETSLLKTMWEKEKLLIRSNFSFSHSVSTIVPFSSNLKLSSSNSFSLEQSKICCLVMGWRCCKWLKIS